MTHLMSFPVFFLGNPFGAYQEHGIHKKDAQKSEAEEDNNAFGTPPSIKHRIPTNRKSPPSPMKPKLNVGEEEEIEMCMDLYPK
ncbi:hypothetical protein AAC387_Pa06g0742 [Persea americana]